MGAGRFRELADRMDALLVDRLGDRARLDDGTVLAGAFAAPFIGPKIGGKSNGFRLASAINADAVREPTFTLRAVDAAGITKGMFLTVDLPAEDGGGRYRFLRPEPDGCGMVDLILGPDNERADDIT